jgi:hypothetical protein
MLKLRKRLHSLVSLQSRLLRAFLVAGLVTVIGCDSEITSLAPYEAHRPLTLLAVTQSATPDIQWVGGRVAAVGVNRGPVAALDSTLVWMVTAPGDEVESHLTLGETIDAEALARYNGSPIERVADGEEYTFWLATHEAYAAGLDPSARNEFTYVDTTVTMNFVVAGIARGGADVSIRVVKDERLLGTRYIVEWTPADHAFRRVAIRRGAALPAFTDLIWHIVLPEDEPDSITSPLIIGEPTEGSIVVQDFPEGGFDPAVHTLWMVDSTWDNTFGARAPGMAAFVMFATNF